MHSPDEQKNRSHLDAAVRRASAFILGQRFPDGYWHYTLEANASIAAEYLLFHRYMGIALEPWRITGIAEQILSEQREDGSWGLYWGAPGSVGATTECYFALKLAGYKPEDTPLQRARDFVLKNGGALKSWVFTRIHLAMFGILPWEAAPEMPPWIILLPPQIPGNIYTFSSWARASIVPLLVVSHFKKTVPLGVSIDELFPHPPTAKDWRFEADQGLFSLENAFISLDRVLKKLPRVKPLRSLALKRCEAWIAEHLRVTEDIFPALMYGAIALHTLGHKAQAAGPLKKALDALKSFQMRSAQKDIPAVPTSPENRAPIYQQCCISPVWDTAWAGLALLRAGSTARVELEKTAEWLLDREVSDYLGDWAIQVPAAKPGGWAFEFENKAFPDVDDTLEVMHFLKRAPLDAAKKRPALERGLQFILSMQSDNGGWASFDRNNTQTWVNRIPFSDHEACLDPPTADLTARAVELLVSFGYTLKMDTVSRAIAFIQSEQTPWGPWPGRWGVSYLYGTWCVLQGLAQAGVSPAEPFMARALAWLQSVQNQDGGWGESCESDDHGLFVPLASTASQTAWAVMALVASGLAQDPACKRGVDFLLRTQNEDGVWDESAFTGTGFPRHFYIRYHGYRHYFPLLALAEYRNAIK